MTEMIVKEIHSDEQVALTDRPSAICCWSSLKPCTPLTSKLPGLHCERQGKILCDCRSFEQHCTE